MVQSYANNGVGRIKVFFSLNENGGIKSIKVGNQVVSVDQGYQFYVDKHVADQIDKCELYMDGLTPKLRLKEGKTLEVPEKTEKEKEIERLKFALEQLEKAE